MKKPTPPRDDAKDDLNKKGIAPAIMPEADVPKPNPEEKPISANDNVYVPPMTEADAAAYLGLSTDALRNRRHNGRGPRFLNFDGAIRYLKADLDAYIESCKVKFKR